MKFIKVNSPSLRKILANPKFKARIAQQVHFNFKYPIPYLAGYSKDGKIVFVDKHLKRYWKYKGRIIDVTDFLIVHEVVEKALIDLFGLHYQQAHHIAQHVEAKAVRQHGINWWDYSKYLKPQIKDAYHETITRAPKQLDLTSYTDEKEKLILQQLQRGRKIRKESLTYQTESSTGGLDGYVNTKTFETSIGLQSRNWNLDLVGET